MCCQHVLGPFERCLSTLPSCTCAFLSVCMKPSLREAVIVFYNPKCSKTYNITILHALYMQERRFLDKCNVCAQAYATLFKDA